jgi:hypothetical protein
MVEQTGSEHWVHSPWSHCTPIICPAGYRLPFFSLSDCPLLQEAKISQMGHMWAELGQNIPMVTHCTLIICPAGYRLLFFLSPTAHCFLPLSCQGALESLLIKKNIVFFKVFSNFVLASKLEATMDSLQFRVSLGNLYGLCSYRHPRNIGEHRYFLI